MEKENRILIVIYKHRIKKRERWKRHYNHLKHID